MLTVMGWLGVSSLLGAVTSVHACIPLAEHFTAKQGHLYGGRNTHF